jgi:hypothetical protein
MGTWYSDDARLAPGGRPPEPPVSKKKKVDT